MSEGKREAFRYQCRVKGVWGRNRKVKFEIFTLVDDVPRTEPKTLDELMPLFRAKLAEIKFKGGIATLTEDPTTVEDYDLGFGRTGQAVSYMLGSQKTLHTEKIEGAGLSFT